METQKVLERTTLDHKELNKRANEVFILDRGEVCWGAGIDTKGPFITMTEKDEKTGEDTMPFNYLPDMTDRPEALDYLMGKRDDFND